ncbi:MAG TPA: CFI-box-CTERM domain-containing protein [Kofleriaceae bacterium]|jgi:hypothetical protein
MWSRVARTSFAVAALAAVAQPAVADPGVCHSIDVTLKPQKRTDLRPGDQQAPQMVAWIEDPAGNYVATIYITQETGTFGLGNRPGRFDFNSAPGWPFGRRIGVFPVWAEKKPERYDTIVFQDSRDDGLSHGVNISSTEHHYCRPMEATGTDAGSYDALSCATSFVGTDKGRRDSSQPNNYPPRQDIARDPSTDSDDVTTYPSLNRFDAISTATPPTGQVTTFGWTMPSDLAAGDYVLLVEASTEFDHNATYSKAARPGPQVAFGSYGEPYRGQPSLVYKVPFTIASDDRVAKTSDYAGYGDPDGANGMLHPPDATISTDTLGSGLDRLGVITDADGSYRVKVTSRLQIDNIAPSAPSQLALNTATSRSAILDFIESGDDNAKGVARSYDVRFRVGSPVTADNFDDADSVSVPSGVTPVMAGEAAEVALTGLLPETHYYVGLRATDDCGNASDVATLDFTTPERMIGEVDSCFIATAAYGSLMATDVTLLRRMRDTVMRKSILGELAVEAYYTFSPPVAGVVGESDLLRWTAREVLLPVVSFFRAYRF